MGERPQFPDAQINPTTITARLIQAESPSRIGIPRRRQVCVGIDDTSGREFLLMGSTKEVGWWLDIENHSELLKKRIKRDWEPMKLKEVIFRTLQTGFDVSSTLEDLIPDYEAGLIRQGFVEGAQLVFGPYADAYVSPGTNPNIQEDRVGVWVLLDGMLAPEWKIVESQTE